MDYKRNGRRKWADERDREFVVLIGATALLAAAGLCLAAPQPAAARSQHVGTAPARNGDEYDGQNHQPPRGEVRAGEQAAGPTSATTEQREAQEVDSLYHELLSRVPPKGGRS